MKKVLLALIAVFAVATAGYGQRTMWQFPLQVPDTGSYIAGYECTTGLFNVVRFKWPTGGVKRITAGNGLNGGTFRDSGTISLPAIGTSGTYGDSGHVPVVTTDAYGRVTGVSTSTINRVTRVTAGNGLDGGTFRDSGTISLPATGTAGTYGDNTHVPVVTTDAYGRVTGVSAVTISSGTVTSVTAGSGLSGGTITTSGTISLPNTGTSGTYGSSRLVPVIVTDAQGRVTNVTSTWIDTSFFETRSYTLGNYHKQGGNNYGKTDTFGTKDRYNIVFKVADSQRALLDTLGNLSIKGTDSATGLWLLLDTAGGNGTSRGKFVFGVKGQSNFGYMEIGNGGANAAAGSLALQVGPSYSASNPGFAISRTGNTFSFPNINILSFNSLVAFQTVQNSTGTNNATWTVGGQGGAYAPTGSTTTTGIVFNNSGWSPTSGSANYNEVRIAPNINSTGSASGVVANLNLDPNLISVGNASFRNLNLNAGAGWNVYNGGSAPNYFGANVLMGTTTDPGEKLTVAGNINISTVGGKIKVAEGVDGTLGISAAMVAGTVTVNCANVTANSRVMLTGVRTGAPPCANCGDLSLGTIVAGVSFTINSSNASDTRQVIYDFKN